MTTLAEALKPEQLVDLELLLVEQSGVEIERWKRRRLNALLKDVRRGDKIPLKGASLRVGAQKHANNRQG